MVLLHTKKTEMIINNAKEYYKSHIITYYTPEMIINNAEEYYK